MKKAFFVVCFLFPGFTNAQSLGCYVDSGTLNLYGAGFLCGLVNVVPVCGSDYSNNFSAFGSAMAELCQDQNETKATLAQCASDYTSCAGNYNSLLAERNYYYANWSACGDTTEQIYGAISYWEGLTHYYEDLTARLRAKCGSKCKKIQ